MTDENTILLGAAVGASAAVANKAYDDLVHPAAQELGQGLGYTARFIKAVFRPLSVAADCINKKCDEFVAKVEETVDSIPPERRIEPSLGVLQPIIAGAWGALDSELVQGLFLNLLKTSMDKSTTSKAFPVHGELIKQLSPDEALILVYLSNTGKYHIVVNAKSKNRGKESPFNVVKENISLLPIQIKLKFPENAPVYLDNLNRSGLIKIDFLQHASPEDIYKHLENTKESLLIKEEIEKDPSKECSFIHGIFYLTNLGQSFCQACISESMKKSFL